MIGRIYVNQTILVKCLNFTHRRLTYKSQRHTIKDNPFYDEEDASHDGLSLIFDHSLSTPEMREYIIKNKLIPDAALNSFISVEADRKLFQKNIRFFNDYSDRDSMPFVAEV